MCFFFAYKKEPLLIISNLLYLSYDRKCCKTPFLIGVIVLAEFWSINRTRAVSRYLHASILYNDIDHFHNPVTTSGVALAGSWQMVYVHTGSVQKQYWPPMFSTTHKSLYSQTDQCNKIKASHRSKTNNVNSSQTHKRKHQDFDKVSTIHSQKTNTIMNECKTNIAKPYSYMPFTFCVRPQQFNTVGQLFHKKKHFQFSKNIFINLK